jgi:hypothetical protein
MEPTPATRFAVDLLRVSVMLTDLADGLLDDLGGDAGVPLVHLLSGSMATALEQVPEEDLNAAGALIEAAVEGALADLERAAMARRRLPMRQAPRRPSCRRVRR